MRAAGGTLAGGGRAEREAGWRWRPWREAVLDLLWPIPCAGCGGMRAGRWLCGNCAEGMAWIEGPRCGVCSLPFAGAGGEFVCQNCAGRRFAFQCCVAGVLVKGRLREMIHRFKYRGERWLARPLAEWMAEALWREPRHSAGKVDVIVPVPLHWRREWVRGYNQAMLLAQQLGGLLGKPVRPLVKRVRHTETQTQFDRKRRQENLAGAFQARLRGEWQGAGVLLVDDVFTTGATLDGCAAVLREAGAGRVIAAAAGRAV